jgi:hypothetical protein
MIEKKTELQRAIEALENAGFHVDRAHEENNREAGNPYSAFSRQEAPTGAICLRITPLKKPVPQKPIPPEKGSITDYSKMAVEHALMAVSVETEQKISEILQDGYIAFIRLISLLCKTSLYIKDNPANPDTKDGLAAIVLSAAAMLYEWDKTKLLSLNNHEEK